MSRYNDLLDECNKNLIFYTNHLDGLRKNIARQEEYKNTLCNIDPNIDLRGFEEIEEFIGYYGYVVIAFLDLSVSLKNLVLAKTDWEKAFFIKHSYLIIHEVAKRLKPFKGRELLIRTTIEKKYPTLKGKLEDLLHTINDFRDSDEYKKIKAVRDSIAGHIDENLKLYYDTVQSLDGEEAGKYISEFLNILNMALALIKEYIEQASILQNVKSRNIGT